MIPGAALAPACCVPPEAHFDSHLSSLGVPAPPVEPPSYPHALDCRRSPRAAAPRPPSPPAGQRGRLAVRQQPAAGAAFLAAAAAVWQPGAGTRAGCRCGLAAPPPAAARLGSAPRQAGTPTVAARRDGAARRRQRGEGGVLPGAPPGGRQRGSHRHRRHAPALLPLALRRCQPY